MQMNATWEGRDGGVLRTLAENEEYAAQGLSCMLQRKRGEWGMWCPRRNGLGILLHLPVQPRYIRKTLS